MQVTRENYPVANSWDYYKVNLTIPLMGHIIEQIEFRSCQKCVTSTIFSTLFLLFLLGVQVLTGK